MMADLRAVDRTRAARDWGFLTTLDFTDRVVLAAG